MSTLCRHIKRPSAYSCATDRILTLNLFSPFKPKIVTPNTLALGNVHASFVFFSTHFCFRPMNPYGTGGL